MPSYSPLRYPGGKSKLAPFMKDVFQANGLLDGTYVEPYAGGAGVAWALLLEGYARNIVINDIDPHIHAFWYAVLNYTEELIRKISDTNVSIEEWGRQKSVFANYEMYDHVDRAFATFFLNRTNRSGILKAGVIGGKNQAGKYRLDARFNKKNLIERIEKIASYRTRITLYNLDALDLLKIIKKKLSSQSLIYFDPPYYHKAQSLYRNFYQHEDHERVSIEIRKIETPWIVTYDNVDEIIDLYQGENFDHFSICYTAHKARPRKREVLFYKNLNLHFSPCTNQKKILNKNNP